MNRRRMIIKILAGFIAMSMLAADVTADVAATELINTKAIESE